MPQIDTQISLSDLSAFGQNRSIYHWKKGWSAFVAQLDYKANWYGRTLVKLEAS